MKPISIFFGIAITAILLAVLVMTRMMVLVKPVAEYEIREIETVNLPEPPPPPPEQQPAEDLPPPPPPALADLSALPDPSQPAVPVSPMKIDPSLAVDTFFSDQPPSPLPQAKLPRREVKTKGPSTPSAPQIRSTPRPKSQYGIGELDQKPRLLRNPSVSFPRSIRNASSGRVVVRVAILPSGRSQYISVISSTHPDLIPAARKIANGSRFTPPTRQGKAVKAVMSWPITIKK